MRSELALSSVSPATPRITRASRVVERAFRLRQNDARNGGRAPLATRANDVVLCRVRWCPQLVGAPRPEPAERVLGNSEAYPTWARSSEPASGAGGAQSVRLQTRPSRRRNVGKLAVRSSKLHSKRVTVWGPWPAPGGSMRRARHIVAHLETISPRPRPPRRRRLYLSALGNAGSPSPRFDRTLRRCPFTGRSPPTRRALASLRPPYALRKIPGAELNRCCGALATPSGRMRYATRRQFRVTVETWGARRVFTVLPTRQTIPRRSFRSPPSPTSVPQPWPVQKGWTLLLGTKTWASSSRAASRWPFTVGERPHPRPPTRPCLILGCRSGRPGSCAPSQGTIMFSGVPFDAATSSRTHRAARPWRGRR